MSWRPRGTARSFDPLHSVRLVRGQGCTVWDAEGQAYLDLVTGYSTLNFGHCHPRLVQAASQALQDLTFASVGESQYRSDVESQLATCVAQSQSAAMNAASPVSSSVLRVWLSTTGARAVEVAWKLAYLRKPGKLLRFDRAYHGRSIATSWISDTQRLDLWDFGTQGREPSLTIPFPDCLRWRATPSLEDRSHAICSACLSALNRASETMELHRTELSALIMEPVLGSRGYYFACPTFLRSLSELAHTHRLSVISDEIQMGLGRLGPLVVSHADGWFPDFLVLGKSLGGGMVPISAVIGAESWMDAMPPGIESETMAATPLACRIAGEVLRLWQTEDFEERTVRLGAAFRSHIVAAGDIPQDAIEGRGLLTVLDVAVGLGEKRPGSASIASRLVEDLRNRGLLVHLTGSNRDRIALIPSLVIEESMLYNAAMLIQASWKQVVCCR